MTDESRADPKKPQRPAPVSRGRSLYRADDQVLVNAHVWGANAFGAPVWHLRRTRAGALFDTCAASFDAVWNTALPVEES